MKNSKRKQLVLLAAIALIASLSSCKEKPKSDDIITQMPVEKKQEGIKRMGDYEYSQNITWLGASYKVSSQLTADPSLPTVKEDGQAYYDNRATVKVLHTDGSVFFERTFSKADFVSYIDEYYRQNGALLGVVYHKAEDDKLYFAASVGSPDKSSDEYIPLTVCLSRDGNVRITRDTQLDTSSDEDAEKEDEGV